MQSVEKVFEKKSSLDGSKEYSAECLYYPFELVVPSNFKQDNTPSGFWGFVSKFFKSSDSVDWYLIARLDIPMSVDVSKRIDVSIY